MKVSVFGNVIAELTHEITEKKMLQAEYFKISSEWIRLVRGSLNSASTAHVLYRKSLGTEMSKTRARYIILLISYTVPLLHICYELGLSLEGSACHKISQFRQKDLHSSIRNRFIINYI